MHIIILKYIERDLVEKSCMHLSAKFYNNFFSEIRRGFSERNIRLLCLRHEISELKYRKVYNIIIHCSIFLHSHWLRAYDEFFVFC